MEKRNESANDLMVEMIITQEELGLLKVIKLKNSQVLKDSKNKIELAKLKKDANLNIEIVGFVDEDTKIINDFADTLETGEINDDIVFDSLEAVTLFIKNSVKDAIKYPHKYADKKVLLNQLYNQQQEFELAEQETYIPKNDFDNYYYQ